MKGNDRNIFILVEFVSIIAGYFIFDLQFDAYSDIITFLSIMLGFEITSLSVLFNSPLKNTLFDRKIDKYKTELHRLRDYYRFAIWLQIFYILLIFLIPDDFCFEFYKFCVAKHLIVMPILLGTVYCFYKLFCDLLKIFVHPTNNN